MTGPPSAAGHREILARLARDTEVGEAERADAEEEKLVRRITAVLSPAGEPAG
jgi:hypothetical protein